MIMAFRVLSVLVGVAMFATGVNWHIDPAGAAGELSMTLLAGMGASTQIGDMSAFFLALGVMIGLGQRHGQTTWLNAAALLVGMAAIGRTLAFLMGNAPLGTGFIVPELVMAFILAMAAWTRAGESAEAPSS
ncbi:MAG: hypothetical protein ACI8W3_003696 [Myxococcota bacterium]|jgi:hypothetical protein